MGIHQFAYFHLLLTILCILVMVSLNCILVLRGNHKLSSDNNCQFYKFTGYCRWPPSLNFCFQCLRLFSRTLGLRLLNVVFYIRLNKR